MLTCYDEDTDADEYLMYTLEGAATEVKLSLRSSYTNCTSLMHTPEMAQLIAGMEKLAGDLAYSAVTARAVLFNSIKIFGVLMSYQSTRSTLVGLHIDFVGQFSTFSIAKDDMDINESLDRLHFHLNRTEKKR